VIDRKHKLSENFTLGEFLHKGVEVDSLPVYIIQNLTKLARELQKVRTKIGKPFVITSGYRTPAHNKAVGGAKNSWHMKGLAADFQVKGMTADEAREAIGDWNGGVELGIPWVHLDLGPKRRFYP